MTLAELNEKLAHTDCSDLEAVAELLTLRARTLAEFAATADAGSLREALDSGAEFLDRLELEQLHASRELDKLLRLKSGLQSALGTRPETQGQVVCFG